MTKKESLTNTLKEKDIEKDSVLKNIFQIQDREEVGGEVIFTRDIYRTAPDAGHKQISILKRNRLRFSLMMCAFAVAIVVTSVFVGYKLINNLDTDVFEFDKLYNDLQSYIERTNAIEVGGVDFTEKFADIKLSANILFQKSSDKYNYDLFVFTSGVADYRLRKIEDKYYLKNDENVWTEADKSEILADVNDTVSGMGMIFKMYYIDKNDIGTLEFNDNCFRIVSKSNENCFIEYQVKEDVITVVSGKLEKAGMVEYTEIFNEVSVNSSSSVSEFHVQLDSSYTRLDLDKVDMNDSDNKEAYPAFLRTYRNFDLDKDGISDEISIDVLRPYSIMDSRAGAFININFGNGDSFQITEGGYAMRGIKQIAVADLAGTGENCIIIMMDMNTLGFRDEYGVYGGIYVVFRDENSSQGYSVVRALLVKSGVEYMAASHVHEIYPVEPIKLIVKRTDDKYRVALRREGGAGGVFDNLFEDIDVREYSGFDTENYDMRYSENVDGTDIYGLEGAGRFDLIKQEDNSYAIRVYTRAWAGSFENTFGYMTYDINYNAQMQCDSFEFGFVQEELPDMDNLLN